MVIFIAGQSGTELTVKRKIPFTGKEDLSEIIKAHYPGEVLMMFDPKCAYLSITKREEFYSVNFQSLSDDFYYFLIREDFDEMLLSEDDLIGIEDVDFETTLKVVEYFFEHRKMDPELKWISIERLFELKQELRDAEREINSPDAKPS